MEADIDVHGKSKQLSGGCKRNQGRPGRGGRLKCKHCRKAAQKVFLSSFEELMASVLGFRKVLLVTGVRREVSELENAEVRCCRSMIQLLDVPSKNYQ